MYATTNGGVNWGFQAVPTISQYQIFFLDSLTGWCGYNGLAKTSNGGGNIIYQGIQQIGNEIPVSYKLFQNYPNPFNPSTKVKYDLPQAGNAVLKIFDVLGDEVVTIINESQTAGIYEAEWNAANYPSGIYFARLTAGEYSKTIKIILIK